MKSQRAEAGHRTQVEVVEAWAEITIKKWRENIVNLRVVNKRQLLSSFKSFVVAEANGDISKVRFAYLYYGKFSDMGVGKGVKSGGGKSNSIAKKLSGKKGKARVAKKWYSKTIATETFILGQIMQDLFAAKGIASVKDNISGQVTVNF